MLINELKKIPSSWMYAHLYSVISDDFLQKKIIKIEEFLKFMYISSVKGCGFIPLSKEIDEIWHEYILQTKEYQALCSSLPNKIFIHHQTGSLENYTKERGRGVVVKNMLEWLPYYYHHFGPFNECSAPYWTMVDFIQKELNYSLQQINEIAKTEAYKMFGN